MSLVKADHLFVRDAVVEELDSKLNGLVAEVLNSDLEYEDTMSGHFFDFCSFQAMQFVTTVTEDEFRFILDNVQVACAVQDLVRQGKVVKEDGVYKLVDDAEDNYCSGC